MEKFKAVQGYEEYYEVSNFGRIKSLPRMRTWGNRTYLTQERFLKQRIHDGYYRVNLCGNTGVKMKTINVHILVINAFHPKEEGRPFANHKDLNRLNNNAENLEWANVNENNQHHFIVRGNKKHKYPGVSRADTKSIRFSARIKRIHIGLFDTEELAFEAILKYKSENNIINRYL